MTKTAKRLTAALFLLFLWGLGLLHLLLPDRTFSAVENRNLAQAPAFSWSALASGSYTSDLETYLADQFPLRDGWMGLKTRYEYLLGQREFNDVYLCGDTLIGKISEGDRAQTNLTYLQALTEKTDLSVYVGLIPTAAEIWRDKLPTGAPSFDQAVYLKKAQAATGAVWVDVAGTLASHADEAVYYRTDHHWTSLGAYYGYAALMEALGEEAQPLGEGDTVSEDFNGTLYSSSGVHWLTPDTIERYVSGEGVTVEDGETGEVHGLYVDSFLTEKDQYASFLGGNAPLYIVRNPNAETEQRLLLVRDSYSDSLAPFLSQYYSEIHLLDLRYYKTSPARYAQENDLDAIFVCYSVENFMEDANIFLLGQ
jgi:hypothetical protein